MRRNVGVERSKARVGEVGKEEVVQDLLLFVVSWLDSVEKPHPKKPAVWLLGQHWVVHW